MSKPRELIPSVKCVHCNGTGKVPDHARLGSELRLARKMKRIGLRDMALRLGVSAGHLHDLEHGRRHWTVPTVSKYKIALNCQ